MHFRIEEFARVTVFLVIFADVVELVNLNPDQCLYCHQCARGQKFFRWKRSLEGNRLFGASPCLAPITCARWLHHMFFPTRWRCETKETPTKTCQQCKMQKTDSWFGRPAGSFRRCWTLGCFGSFLSLLIDLAERCGAQPKAIQLVLPTANKDSVLHKQQEG